MFLALACHAADAHAQSCQKDNDCPGDLICNGGQCQTTSGATPPPAAVTPASPGAVAAPAAGTVTVQFEGEPALLSETVTGQSCRVPCSMQLVPGNYSITVDNFQTHAILVPAHGGSLHVTKRDSGAIFGGALLTTFGGIGFAIGLALTIIGDTTEEDDPSTYYTDESEGGADLGAIGVPVLLGSAAMLGGGIALLSSADGGSLEPSKTPPAVAGTPMIGVVPVRGGVLAGAAIRF